MTGLGRIFFAIFLLLTGTFALAQNDHRPTTALSDAALAQQIERAAFSGHSDGHENALHQNDGVHRSGGRLSPDERRELRRQINEVGQDIYRPVR